MPEPAPGATGADTGDRITDRASAHRDLLAALAAPPQVRALDAAGATIADALDAGGTVYVFGNGGSASDAQHLTAELVGRFRADRRALAAVTLGTNPAVASALGNDYGFAEAGLARELEALGRPGDVAVALSTSGRSPNVLAALDVARERGLHTVALTGGGHALAGRVDHVVAVDTDVVALVQEMHAVIGHLLCEIVEERLGLA